MTMRLEGGFGSLCFGDAPPRPLWFVSVSLPPDRCGPKLKGYGLYCIVLYFSKEDRQTTDRRLTIANGRAVPIIPKVTYRCLGMFGDDDTRGRLVSGNAQ
jgi:hypothetical protein